MVTKKVCIELFNEMIRGTPVSFEKDLLPIILDYLTENNIENSEKIINLIIQNPTLAQNIMNNVVEYFCKKYSILRLQIKSNFNFKTILYYE